MIRLIDHFVDWWMRRCVHYDHHVAADILEGDGPIQVKYCRRCGAVRIGDLWRRPRPLWYPE